MSSNLSVSKRVGSLKPSVTVAITNRAKQLKADGVDVLGFAAGEPDFDTPEPVKQAAIEAMLAGQTKYMPTLGDMPTREVVAQKLTIENSIPDLNGSNIAISAGAKHALFTALQCLLDPAEPGESPAEVILAVPAWVSYRPITELSGGRVVEVETTPESDFKMTAAQLEAAITPASRVLVLNSPSNPCGTMYTEQELRDIAQVVAKAAQTRAPNLVILSDEIYEKIVYGGIEHFSIGSIPEVAHRTITLNGLSKAYAMTGWRVGYAAMPGPFGEQFIRTMGTLQGQMTTNITSFNYAALRCALTSEEVRNQVELMRQAFAKRAKLIYERISKIESIRCPKPTGAFYVFPDISNLFGRTTPGGRVLGSAFDLSEALLEEALLAFVPGEDFGGTGGDCVRISFACSEDQINNGMDRFEEFISKLR